LKKAIPKLWKETLITQDSIKTQVIQKKNVKIEKNQIQNLQMKNKEGYKILLESQVKEKPIAYTKWEIFLSVLISSFVCFLIWL
jgi:hypothetical protein